MNKPTPIQEKCVPQILAGQKVIGIAPTGTGKTAAFLLPLLSKLNFAQGESPRLLILAPTKELVIQITSQVRLFSKYTDLRVVDLYGGVGPKVQRDKLLSGTDIIVSTPGRFMELYLLNGISTRLIKNLVIDEADRMMDMNFMPQLRKILEVLPSKRQDILFSATFSNKVERMANEFIDFPLRIEVSPQSTVTRQVSQVQYEVPNFKTKLNFLMSFFKDDSFSRVIIFTRTKQTVINLAKFLSRLDLGEIRAVHSNKSQNSRIASVKLFHEGGIRALISTDVSSRGLDFKDVTHVVNFDVPLLYEDYVHRIGRTGRAFSVGMAITFVTPSDVYHMTRIESLINDIIPKATLPNSIVIEETLYDEAQKIARELDRQKKIEDPTYGGAFHDRKKK